jgi:hypothetical protein
MKKARPAHSLSGNHDQAMPSRQARQTRNSRVWVFVVKIIGRDFRKRFESSQRKDSMPRKKHLGSGKELTKV